MERSQGDFGDQVLYYDNQTFIHIYIYLKQYEKSVTRI